MSPVICQVPPRGVDDGHSRQTHADPAQIRRLTYIVATVRHRRSSLPATCEPVAIHSTPDRVWRAVRVVIRVMES
jgi:hypothetical protein